MRTCLLALLLASLPTTALAQDPTELLERGIAARQAGDDEQALQLFEQAHAIRPSGVTLAQMGLAEQAVGRWVVADAHLREALETADEFVQRNRSVLAQALDRIQEHLALLELLGGADGAEVFVNGQSRGTMPLSGPVRVGSGSSVLEVRLADHHPFRRTFELAAGTIGRETVVLVPLEHDAPAPVETRGGSAGATASNGQPLDTTTSDDEGGASTALLVLGGVTAVLAAGGIAVGVGFAVAREGHANTFNGPTCDEPSRPRAEVCPDLPGRVADAESAYIGAFVGGGILAIASIVFFGAAAASGGGSSDSTSFSCGSGPGLVGLSCGGHF